MLAFNAHCQKGHDRVVFTDRAAFEAHMTGEHGKRKLYAGQRLPDDRAGAPGWSGGKIAKPYPHKAPAVPKDWQAKLAAVLEEANRDKWGVIPNPDLRPVQYAEIEAAA